MDRLGQFTLQEKVSLCRGSDMWHTTPVPRLGIPSVMVADGPHGLRRQPDHGDPVGIGRSLPATCFPTASALGSSWDPDLVEEIGTAIADEALAQGVAVVLGPGINIKRSPLCGRNFEYYSEDPLVSGTLGALVRGLQSRGVGASVKHFAANNQETDRLRVSADVDERTLREIYLAAFERVVREAQPWTVMCAYNRINGIHASQHRWLLTEVLRAEWGFEGVVVSDWGAVHDRVAALAAGLDLEMPPNTEVSDAALVAAVRDGLLDEKLLDRAVLRVLSLVDKATAARRANGFDAAAHHQLARTAAADCAVLLKNADGVLPLRPDAGDLIAVMGEFARTPRFQGAGSSQVNPTRVDVPLEELREAVPAGVEVAFAPAFRLDGDQDARLTAEAVALAKRATTVVLFLGLPPAAESEGFDRDHMDLPANQVALLSALRAVNSRVVVVLANGSAVCLSTWEDDASAVLECWLAGQAAGGAIADLLLGKANPSGRLAETLPLRLEHSPAHLNFPGEHGHVRYGEGIFVGYRGYDFADRQVSYPFGHGLSYTTFAYGDVDAVVTGSVEGDDLAVELTCTVKNTGDRVGKETVQLYVGAPHGKVTRPVRELKAFVKISLYPGEQRTVTFHLGARDLAYWSSAHRRWVVEAGTYQLFVGASSRDLRLSTTAAIAAPDIPVPLDAMATLEDWLADPAGADALRRAVGTDTDGAPLGILGDPSLMRLLGNFPLHSLANFPGVGFDQATVAVLLERFAHNADVSG
ncbi:beta-glucosidase [Asanoa hainanensis]|uniref:Exo-alpha-(1->6)-L-arabinopyranosidase n=1 Tax=Asanoa hainanensis TaxID=560556 RepID=A0A239PGF2_9ACTN|nr:beta-glucosidase [Asanoa hainanensis]